LVNDTNCNTVNLLSPKKEMTNNVGLAFSVVTLNIMFNVLMLFG
jgi:hypothetical protein